VRLQLIRIAKQLWVLILLKTLYLFLGFYKQNAPGLNPQWLIFQKKILDFGTLDDGNIFYPQPQAHSSEVIGSYGVDVD
jgi:hypothetical protein